MECIFGPIQVQVATPPKYAFMTHTQTQAHTQFQAHTLSVTVLGHLDFHTCAEMNWVGKFRVVSGLILGPILALLALGIVLGT